MVAISDEAAAPVAQLACKEGEWACPSKTEPLVGCTGEIMMGEDAGRPAEIATDSCQTSLPQTGDLSESNSFVKKESTEAFAGQDEPVVKQENFISPVVKQEDGISPIVKEEDALSPKIKREEEVISTKQSAGQDEPVVKQENSISPVFMQDNGISPIVAEEDALSREVKREEGISNVLPEIATECSPIAKDGFPGSQNGEISLAPFADSVEDLGKEPVCKPDDDKPLQCGEDCEQKPIDLNEVAKIQPAHSYNNAKISLALSASNEDANLGNETPCNVDSAKLSQSGEDSEQLLNDQGELEVQCPVHSCPHTGVGDEQLSCDERENSESVETEYENSGKQSDANDKMMDESQGSKDDTESNSNADVNLSNEPNHVESSGKTRKRCQFCEKRFRTISHLKVHLRVHTLEKPFQCEICEKTFTQRSTKNRHAIVHTGERPFSCELCGKSFAQKSTLTGHLMMHTGEKPFGCCLCGKHFVKRSHRARHIRTVHRQEPIKRRQYSETENRSIKKVAAGSKVSKVRTMTKPIPSNEDKSSVGADGMESARYPKRRRSSVQRFIPDEIVSEPTPLDDDEPMNDETESTKQPKRRRSSVTQFVPEQPMAESTPIDADDQIDDADEVDMAGYPTRRRSSIIPSIGLRVTKPKKSIPTWCVLCERPIGEKYDQHLDMPGAVACQNSSCKRSFHLACLHDIGTDIVEPDNFRCDACVLNQPLCLECQKPVAEEDSVRCPARQCPKQYHRACWKWDDRPCPTHECRKCALLNVEGESRTFHSAIDKYSCVRCTTRYHVSCIPKTAVRLDLGPSKCNKFVCERHEALPKSIRWRPLLIIPLWVGDGVLTELPFALPPEWINGTCADDENDVIIHPQVLSSSDTASPRKKPKRKSFSKSIPSRSAFSYQLTAKAKKLSIGKERPGKKKTQGKQPPALESAVNDENLQLESQPLYSDDLEYIPAFSTEPPPGFVMEPYKRRSRNCYIMPRPLQNSREAAHICSCIPGTNCADDSCVNRSLQIECDARFCPCGDQCQNQRIQKREWQPMRLIFTQDRGCGMMSQVPIKAGDLVIEYVGEVLDELTFRQRIQENTEKKRPQDNYYMMQLSRQIVIDARKTGNSARFLNHSCSPNCRTEIWEVAKGELRAGIFAMYDIPAGVELTYDYNFELFSKAVNSESVPCRCGAKNCSKFLGARPLRNTSKKLAVKAVPENK